MSLLMEALKKAEQAKSKSDKGIIAPPTKPEQANSYEELEAQVEHLVGVNEPDDSLVNLNVEVVEVVDESVTLPAADELILSLDEVEAAEPVVLEVLEPKVEENTASADTTKIENSPSLEVLTEAPTEPLLESVAEPIDERLPQTINPEATTPAQPEPPEPVSTASIEVEVPVAKNVLTPPHTSPMLIGQRKFNRTYLWAGLVIVLALVGFGYYLMAMLEPTQSYSSAAPLASDWQSEDVIEEVVAEVKAVASILPTPTEQLTPTVEKKSLPVVPAPKAQVKAPAPKAAVVVEKPTPVTKSQALLKKPVQAPARTLSIQRVEVEDPLFSVLQQAYAKYQSGALVSAEQLYLQILQRDSSNRDALMGLAAIARRQDRPADARSLYRRLLTLNPKDSMAASGLMALSGQGLSLNNATQLKLMLSEEPSAAHLHFALGNEYASHSLWSEAQQAYFKAYRFELGNGDYAYNLAVSLEHIGQPEAALDYYRRALELASGGADSFDAVTVMQRIDLISQAEDI